MIGFEWNPRAPLPAPIFAGFGQHRSGLNYVDSSPYRREALTTAALNWRHNGHRFGAKFSGSQFINVESLRCGWEVPGGFTNTGLTYDSSDGTLWVTDFTNSRLKNVTVGGALISTVTPFAGTNLQGIAYDSSDDTLWVGNSGDATVRHMNTDGSDAGGGFTASHTANGIAYEVGRDSVWVMSGSALERRNAADGTLTETLTLSGWTPSFLDHIVHNPTDDRLYLTEDSSGGVIRKVNKTTGALISTINCGQAIEGIATDGTDFWVCCDALFHGGTTGGNRVMKIDSSGGSLDSPLRTEVTMFSFYQPSATQTNNALFGCREVDAGRFQAQLLTGSAAFCRIERAGGSSTNATGTTAITDVNRVYAICYRYDGATLKVYVDGKEEASTAGTGPIRCQPDRFWIGGYFTTSNCISGTMYDPLIFDKALSLQQIRWISNPCNKAWRVNYRRREGKVGVAPAGNRRRRLICGAAA